MTCRVRARAARGEDSGAGLERDPDIVGSCLEDAAHYTGGHAAAIAFPRTEADVARLVRQSARVLPIGAQSSVTGGATPMGEVVLSSSRMDSVLHLGTDRIRVEAGLPVASLKQLLAAKGLYYPPAPTYDGAFVGGTIATNASGAATFKYGSTRQWVRALTVVLASGDVLEIERGQAGADERGLFEIEASCGVLHVPVPAYTMPDVPKRSAGYHAEPGMDLVDLFVGSEGTLGVIVEVTLDLVAPPPAICVALVPVASEPAGLGLVASLREESLATRRARDPRGLDVSAIEHMDRRSLQLLREDGADRKHGVSWPPATELLLLAQVELPPGTSAEEAFEHLSNAREPGAPDAPLVRFCRILDRFGAFDDTEVALPGDVRRASQFFELREAVPSAVKHRIGILKETVDPTIEKTAADMIVPFERFGEMMEMYRRGYSERGLDYAIWGHISDAHVHPNVIPRSAAEMRSGREAILEFGKRVVSLGGSPLAEHGVGRSSLKQALLRLLYGDEGIEEMRAVKAALDPTWKLSPGVLFPSPRHKGGARLA
ncbi:MAG: FAD-binding oxidoreductase [Vicinamibacterales bacterium]